jgi:hypothetical protein
MNLDRLIELHQSLCEKADQCHKKAMRARTIKMIDHWHDARQLYYRWETRARDLIYITRFPKVKGSFAHASSQKEYQYWLAEKEKRRQNFLNKHRYATWFMQTSFGSDYGSYSCDKCGRTFYHSPSTITKAAKEVYHCCCGYCTNEIIKRDWNEQPYG